LRTARPSFLSLKTTDRHLQSLCSCRLACSGAALGRWKLVLDSQPTQNGFCCAARKRPHPSSHVSCSPAGSASRDSHDPSASTAPCTMLSERRDRRLEATSLGEGHCGVLVGASRQTRKNSGRSRRGQRSWGSTRRLQRTAGVSAARSAPRYQVVRSLPRCDPSPRGQADMWNAGAIAMRHFLHWPCGSRLVMRRSLRPGDPRCKLKPLHQHRR
jgi:hypothetical protein